MVAFTIFGIILLVAAGAVYYMRRTKKTPQQVLDRVRKEFDPPKAPEPTPAPPVVVAPPVVTAPPVVEAPRTTLLDVYESPSALKADADRLQIRFAVSVDGTSIVHAGFGPPIPYVSTPQGTVRRA